MVWINKARSVAGTRLQNKCLVTAKPQSLGKTISQLIVPDTYLDEQAQLEQVVRKGQKIRYVQTVRQHKSGLQYAVSLNVSPILDEKGQFIGSALTVNDISHIKLAEQKLQQANRRAGASGRAAYC